MREVPVYEAKTRLSELIAAVESGERVLITRRGVPVAQLVAAAERDKRQRQERRKRIEDAFAELKRYGTGASLDVPLPEAIDEGRD